MLSSRQEAILRFVGKYHEKNGYSPTLREIGADVGLSSTQSVTGQLRTLKAKGLLGYQPSCARTVFLTDEGREAFSSLSRVPAGVGGETS